MPSWILKPGCKANQAAPPTLPKGYALSRKSGRRPSIADRPDKRASGHGACRLLTASGRVATCPGMREADEPPGDRRRMRVETLLPLGKVDPGLRAPDVPLDVTRVFDDARAVEQLGYDGLVFEECKEDPFQLIALAAQATTRLRLGTAVAIVFPRSPTSMAMAAWTAQRLSRGRFTLGLGTQVRAHIERRYGMGWSPAGPWVREYVGALRAVWRCWQNGDRLNF